MEEKELTVLKGQVTKLENLANEITIATPEENAAATELKAKLKEIGKTLKDRKEEITGPLNAALKSARALFAPLEERYETAETIVGKKLIAYKQKVEAEARAEEAKIAAKLEAERAKLEAEVEAGKITAEKAEAKLDVKLQKAEEKLESVEKVDKTVQTAHGQVQFRKIKKVRITNEELIPRYYLVVDTVKVRRDVLAGMDVPGAEIYEEETV